MAARFTGSSQTKKNDWPDWTQAMTDYNWQDDSQKCWAFWLRFMRLTSGRTTFKSIQEMYDVESWGLIP